MYIIELKHALTITNNTMRMPKKFNHCFENNFLSSCVVYVRAYRMNNYYMDPIYQLFRAEPRIKEGLWTFFFKNLDTKPIDFGLYEDICEYDIVSFVGENMDGKIDIMSYIPRNEVSKK